MDVLDSAVVVNDVSAAVPAVTMWWAQALGASHPLAGDTGEDLGMVLTEQAEDAEIAFFSAVKTAG